MSTTSRRLALFHLLLPFCSSRSGQRFGARPRLTFLRGC
ncbi:uncharacterized protein CCOS01_16024 [Colletotrichum costaricense]|uniref:Uncharacterized protein n=1 Tax=Colletotrichum costaricense TaxID=1209916 RepID=A0AAI9YG58_9PEZI|nr:uncharacterized protein CCOS01_16024 [Colletotrichum costaricense]KAK1508023.1 hypothetical protein CCOS01_16024 [Colletotrichum costaricense]